MRGCAYAGGNGFYLFAKANLSGQSVDGFICDGCRLAVGRYALGLTVAARQNIAYAHTAPQPS